MEENKYKDALERAREIYFNKEYKPNEAALVKEILAEIFIELEESESERERKKIINFLDELRTKIGCCLEREECRNIEGRILAIIRWLEKVKNFDKQLEDAYKTADEVQYNRGYQAAMDEMEKQDKQTADCPQNHQDVNHPNGCITMEDFSGGEGFYKLNLDLLNKKQVEDVEEMVRMWNNESKTSNEVIKNCIGMCLTDVCEQRFKDYNTSLKDCLAWLEKVKNFDKQLEQAYKNSDEVQYRRGYDKGYMDGYVMGGSMEELEKQGEMPTTISVDKMVEEFEIARIEANGICQIIESNAYRKGVVDTLSKIFIKEEKPITLGSKKAEGKLGEMIAASKEPAKSGEEDKQLTHSQVTKKSDKVWNEDDEKNLQGVIDEIQANKSSAPEYDLKTYDKFLSWLKSLKCRVQPQPKQEWSEEDEEMKDLIDEISCHNDDVDYETHVRITRWLNELKQRLS